MTDPSVYPGRLWSSSEWDYQIEFHTLYVRTFDSHEDWAAQLDRRFEITMVLFDRVTRQMEVSYAIYDEYPASVEESRALRRELTVQLRIQLSRLKTVIQDRHSEWEIQQATSE